MPNKDPFLRGPLPERALHKEFYDQDVYFPKILSFFPMGAFQYILGHYCVSSEK